MGFQSKDLLNSGSIHELSFSDQTMVENELNPGERIQWVGQPKPTFFSGGSLGLFLFAIPWTGFAIFWTSMAFWMTNQDDNTPFFFRIFFPLFGVPFILIGLFMLSTPIRNYRNSGSTIYLITDQRVILFSGRRTKVIQAYGLTTLGEIHRSQHRDGSGDLMFDSEDTPIVLERIQNTKGVEDILRRQVNRNKTSEF